MADSTRRTYAAAKSSLFRRVNAVRDLASSLGIMAFSEGGGGYASGSALGQPPPPPKLALAGRDNPLRQPPFKRANAHGKAHILVQDEVLWRDFKVELKASGVRTGVGTKTVLLKFVASRIPNDEASMRAAINRLRNREQVEDYIIRVGAGREGGYGSSYSIRSLGFSRCAASLISERAQSNPGGGGASAGKGGKQFLSITSAFGHLDIPSHIFARHVPANTSCITERAGGYSASSALLRGTKRGDAEEEESAAHHNHVRVRRVPTLRR